MRLSTTILLLAMVPGLASAQAMDRIDQPVTAADLSSDYQNHSDARTNIEYDIIAPKGTAKSALGTRFARGGESFEIVGEMARDETYDPGLSDTFPRVIYQARKLVSPPPPPPPPPSPPEATGREILVTIDFRPTKPPERQPQPDYFEAYVAEIRRGVCKGCKQEREERLVPRDTERWEYRKVGSHPQ